jgi:pyridoxal phosphate enzyme (YggS family)
MPINIQAYQDLQEELVSRNVTLIAVSKTKPAEDILALYNLGHRDFGENYVQELVAKSAELPADVRWHYIGHLQTNKVKHIVPFVQLIHGVDSLKLLKEINKEADKAGRIINCLLQVHIAKEETKFGLDEKELESLMKEFVKGEMPNVKLNGLMGIASLTEDMEQVRKEFRYLRQLFERYRGIVPSFNTLSIGMSADYRVAVEEGSTMIRIGSRLFGERSR